MTIATTTAMISGMAMFGWSAWICASVFPMAVSQNRPNSVYQPAPMMK